MDMTKTTIVGIPLINEATGDGIITVLELEKMSWLGVTFGAWFKIGMAIALVLLIAERALSVWGKIRRRD